MGPRGRPCRCCCRLLNVRGMSVVSALYQGESLYHQRCVVTYHCNFFCVYVGLSQPITLSRPCSRSDPAPWERCLHVSRDPCRACSPSARQRRARGHKPASCTACHQWPGAPCQDVPAAMQHVMVTVQTPRASAGPTIWLPLTPAQKDALPGRIIDRLQCVAHVCDQLLRKGTVSLSPRIAAHAQKTRRAAASSSQSPVLPMAGAAATGPPCSPPPAAAAVTSSSRGSQQTCPRPSPWTWRLSRPSSRPLPPRRWPPAAR